MPTYSAHTRSLATGLGAQLGSEASRLMTEASKLSTMAAKIEACDDGPDTDLNIAYDEAVRWFDAADGFAPRLGGIGSLIGQFTRLTFAMGADESPCTSLEADLLQTRTILTAREANEVELRATIASRDVLIAHLIDEADDARREIEHLGGET
jgi:hypothetical protein